MYTTKSLIEGHLGRSLKDGEANNLKVTIGAVSEWIDSITGTSWEPTGDPTTRLYDGGGEFVFIDPATDITLVEYLDGYDNVLYEYDDTYFQAYPLNKTVKTSIRLRRLRRWPGSVGRLRVTATWGEGDTVPNDIQLAATIMAADFYNKAGENKLMLEEIEGYARRFYDNQDLPPEVMEILQARKRIIL